MHWVTWVSVCALEEWADYTQRLLSMQLGDAGLARCLYVSDDQSNDW